MMSKAALVLLLGLATGHASTVCSQPLSLATRSALAQLPVVCRLRGGADDLDAELEGDLDDVNTDLDVAAATDGLANPFLSQSGAGAADGAGAGLGMGLEDLASTLQDPKILQDALKELQDPATQARVKAMMEDPAFQESMKAYMDQMTKDPQFETLKKQAEQMLQQEGFVE